MKKYVVLLNNVNLIYRNEQDLVNKCRAFSNIDFLIYKSFTFAGGTGRTKTVKEEIDFVIQSQQKQNINFMNKEEFINAWDLKNFLNRDVVHLSGGWRKFLGIALYTNQISIGKIYFDVSRHLSKRLFDIFLINLKLTTEKVAFFFEYDISIFAQEKIEFLYDHMDRLSKNKSCDQILSDLKETNYD